MEPSANLEKPKTSFRWWFGLMLTLVILGITTMCQLHILRVADAVSKLHKDLAHIKVIMENIRDKPIDTTNVTHEEMQKLIFQVSSIENFVRTTPLVECGNKQKQR